ncbi:MAG TPA: guanylate kinase [Acidobacteriota bacterium]|jgi:guanylate kinase|nr:guanylate kinase [Acidobacteriota bacterium]HNR39129.1 guanylate kinase [Acidobacteriota bacterium]HNU00949.1 guanylate kinase [Acidobacteriota bacterium]HOB53915.1 guanylate kinase [Acidobacteriota bacterium]HOT00101.1 guanylate kinase [Acidobacteriota bacterium]
MSETGTLFIISAPSGSGKTSIVQHLLGTVAGLEFSVSYTTRGPRAGEVHGRDYFFVDEPTFRRMIAADEFYEWAVVYNDLKGTSRAFIDERLARGADVLLDIDVQGAMQIKAINPKAILVFILPPSFPVLAERLRRRGLDDEAEVQRRLAKARDEIRRYEEYHYVVVNEDLAASVETVRAIIRAERQRTAANRNRIGTIIQTFGEAYHV